MKRKFALFVLGMFLISMVGFVSAGPVEDINNFINGVIEFLDKTKLFSAILGDIPEGDLFFAKILFFAIVFSIVYLILGNVTLFEDNTWALWVVSIAASILSIRFITDGGLIQTIILPYSALGVAISAAIPFVIAFLVIETGMKGRKNKTVRKIAWIFFTVVFLALWLTRSVDDTLTGTWEWMYIFTAALSLLMLQLDGTIQKWRARMNSEKATAEKNLELIYKLEDDIRKMSERVADGGYVAVGGKPKFDREIKRKREIIADLAS